MQKSRTIAKNSTIQGLPLTGPSRVVALALNHAESIGMNREQLLRQTGLDELALRDPDARAPIDSMLMLWQALTEFAPDIDHGLEIVDRTTVRDFGLAGYAMETSSSLGDALDRYLGYIRLVAAWFVYKLNLSADEVELTLGRDPRLDALRHPIDLRLGMVIHFSRLITGTNIEPIRVDLPYVSPPSTERYESIFGTTPCFQQPTARLVLRRGDLELPLVRADDALRAQLDRMAIDALKKLRTSGTTTAEVRRILWSDLSSGRVDLEHVASRLGVGPRTLQRRLDEEGSSYDEVLNKFRSDASAHLLKDPSLTVPEVAFILGYSEPSTFYHAFRRWRRVTPAQFREQSY